MTPLRVIIVFIFTLGLLVGAVFALDTRGDSSGWFAAAALSAVGLAWTFWGETGAVPVWTEPQSATAPPPPIPLAAVVSAPSPSPATASTPKQSPFEEYFERAPLPLVVIDREGHIARMNGAAEAVTQYAAAEVRSQPYWNLFLKEAEWAEAAENYRTAMLDRKAPPRRESWSLRMGGVAEFEWWRTLLRDEFGQATGVLAAAMPVAPASPTVNMTALTDQLTAVNGYSEYLLMSMDEANPMRRDLESIHRAGMAASSSLSAR
jgi:PAS domain S-box-containing protein